MSSQQSNTCEKARLGLFLPLDVSAGCISHVPVIEARYAWVQLPPLVKLETLTATRSGRALWMTGDGHV